MAHPGPKPRHAAPLGAAGGEVRGSVRAGAVGSKCKCSPESWPLFFGGSLGYIFIIWIFFPLQVHL